MHKTINSIFVYTTKNGKKGFAHWQTCKNKPCNFCIEAKKAQDKLDALRLQKNLTNSIPLNCNICNEFLCFVYMGDLEGSKFFCNRCKKVRI